MNWKLIFRSATILFLLLIILLRNVDYYQTLINKIDMLFVGEKISVPKIHLILGNKGLEIGEYFILHGYFLEFLEGFLAFKLLGISIGSFLFFDSLLIVITYLLFFTLLSLNIATDTLFVVASFFFLATNLRFRILNGFVSLIYFLYLFVVFKKRNISLTDLLALTAFVFLNFFYSQENGYYLLITHILLIIVILTKLTRKISLRVKLNRLKPSFFNQIVVLIGGLIILKFIFSNYIYLYRLVVIIPRMPFIIFKANIPPFNSTYVFPYYIPLFLMLLNAFFLIFAYKKGIKPSYLILVFVFAVLNLYGIYVRAKPGTVRYDINNISYFIHYQVLVAFVLLNKFIVKKDVKTSLLFFTLSFILILPFFNPEIFTNHLNSLRGNFFKRIQFFIDLPHTPDSMWVNESKLQIANFIKENTKKNDYVYVFNNEDLYYYLSERRNPTIFYTASLAESKEFQVETIKELEKNPPKFIIYSSLYWTNTMDNIPMSNRLNLVNDWILKNYTRQKQIDDTLLLYR